MKESIYRNRNSKQVAYFPRSRAYIHNPGMGIVSMLYSDHMVDMHIPELNGLGGAAFDRAHQVSRHIPTYDEMLAAANYEYTDNCYLRVGWRDLQQSSGRLDLSDDVKRALDAVKTSGKSWSLRVMQCSPTNPEPSLLPDFLSWLPCAEVDGENSSEGKKLLPLYTEDYFKYWSEFCSLLGEKFDSDESLAYVDLSGYGFWGEGHHGSKRLSANDDEKLFDPIAGNERVERLISIHEQSFRLTPMVLNAHHCEYEAGRDALERGAWVRRDSYFLWFKPQEAECGLCRKPSAGVVAETIIPLDSPPRRTPDSGNAFRSFLDLPGLKCDWGCHYGVVGFNPADTLFAAKSYPELFADFAERIGYRVRPSIVWLTGDDSQRWLTLGMVNDGCVGIPGELTLTAECMGVYTHTVVSDDDNYNMCGHMTLIDLPLPDNASGKVKLSAELRMRGKRAPVRFATDCADGVVPYVLTIDV